MDLWAFSFPTRILFGSGAIERLGPEARQLGKRALLVTDRGVVATGAADRVRRLLRKARVDADVFSELETNPTEASALAAGRAFKKMRADLVVALGGGSPLDTGKIVRLLATHKGPLARYDDAKGGGKFVGPNLPPMIAIPTTAGTGSEVGRSGVVTIAKTQKKTVLFSPHLIPTLAIADPELTVTMPARITAATGFDALTHSVEAFLAKGYHPMADAIALEGIRIVGRALVAAFDEPKNIEARSQMMMAAIMGAVAFQKGLGACHSLAHPLSAVYGLHHGLANALVLPAVLEWNAGVVPERVAIAGIALGGAQGTATQVRNIRKRLGLPEGLTAAGVPNDAPARLAPLAFEDACHRGNPRPCTADDLRVLYEASA